MPTPDSARPAGALTCKAYAALRGVTAMAVTRAIKSGRLAQSIGRDPDGKPFVISREAADAEWLKNTDTTRVSDAHKVAAGAAFAGTSPGLIAPVELNVAASAARAKHWEAEHRRLKFLEAAKQLVPAADVETTWAKLVTNAKTRLLALPVRMKHAIPHLTPADLGTVEQLIREALEELAT